MGRPRNMRGRGGRGGGAATAPRANTQTNMNIARPRVSELPKCLTIDVGRRTIPAALVERFPEFRKAQPYFSVLEKLQPEFGGSSERYDQCWIGISGESLNDVERDSDSTFHAVLKTAAGDAPVFVKRVHLLDPLNAMQGDYVWPEDGGLPAPSDLWKSALAKINEPMNEAYTDALFAMCASRMVESGHSAHWCKCYGTYSARVDRYLYNISEEYDSLRVKPWWRRNQKLGLFSIPPPEDESDASPNPIFAATGEELDVADFEMVDSELPTNSVICVAAEETKEDEPVHDGNEPIVLSAPKLRLRRITPDSKGSETESGDDDDDDYEDMFAEFNNFPVQVTFLERAQGTMDDLLDAEEPEMSETKEQRWSAWLFQVIAALIEAQYYYGFVHNDLHTNNVMWVDTELTHICYKVMKSGSTHYMNVPTYGKLMKIIDFGRASFTLPEPAGFFISDAFFPGNDACTQYNCEPFYDPKEGKKVEPNTSFDLCRLSVSMIEALYPEVPKAAQPVKVMSREGGKMYPETESGVYNMLWEWLIDDSGQNILRLPNGKERYPDFDLYRAISTDVHRAIPAKQIDRALFRPWRSDVAGTGPVYELHIA